MQWIHVRGSEQETVRALVMIQWLRMSGTNGQVWEILEEGMSRGINEEGGLA